MANIIFTNNCNIRCPFCFASENNSQEDRESFDYDIHKTWDITSFLDKKVFRFCGGEPTQNPIIIDTLKILLKSDYHILLMTNGIWPQDFIDYIKSLTHSKKLNISYLFNILSPNFYKKEELIILHKTLEVITANNSTLGLTIL